MPHLAFVVAAFDPAASFHDAGGVFASEKTVDDSIVERVEAPGTAVVFREHGRHANQRQRTLALTAVQMAVVAGHAAWREARRFAWRVREDAKPLSNFVRKL